jgi:hypothetical protein
MTLPMATLSRLGRLFARLATHRERQRAESSLRDLALAFDTGPVLASVEPAQCLVDAAQRLGLHLEQGDVDVALDIRVGHFEVITHVREAIGAPVADAILDLIVQRAPAVAQDLRQDRVPYGGVEHDGLLRHTACRKRPTTSVRL